MKTGLTQGHRSTLGWSRTPGEEGLTHDNGANMERSKQNRRDDRKDRIEILTAMVSKAAKVIVNPIPRCRRLGWGSSKVGCGVNPTR
jgi:hypothetical protein